MMKNIIVSVLIIFFGPAFAFSATVDTVNIPSHALGRSSKCVVILPDSYSQNDTAKFAVVYLLHGYSGDYANWIKRVPEIKKYSDEFQLILVCPDAKNSWYIDSKNVSGSNYETYVAIELPHFIDSSYRTISKRDFRAICGLSMGGHGALFLGIRHQDIFGAAGSMSGVLDLVPWKNKYGIENIIGDTSSEVIGDFSVINLPDHIKVTIPLIIDCGVSDPFIDANRRTHAKFLALKVPHDYIERFGTHNWDYWTNAISYQLLFFKRFFEENSKIEIDLVRLIQ